MSVIYIRNKDGALVPISSNNTIKTVNGVGPDESGNIEITIPDSGGNADQSVSVLMADMVLADTANAPKKLPIKTHSSGKDQPIHPKVLYFPELFGGHKFWMAYTPYPNASDAEENPCIACSDDMVTWITPPGVTNPLDVGTAENYMSDTHLVYNSDTALLEIWYRQVLDGKEVIYRRTSANGVEWGEREEMFRTPTTGYNGIGNFLSPVIIYEDGIYKIWAGSGVPSGYLKYYESADGTKWELKATTNLKGWHFDVIHTEEGYEAFICDTQFCESVTYSKSTDGITWDEKTQLLTVGTSGSWDAKRMYRTSAVKINGYYFVYYTGVASDNTWGIGLTVSTVANDVTSFRGYTDGTAIETTPFQMMQSLLFRVNALSKSAGGDTDGGENPDIPDEPDIPATIPCTGITLDKTELTFNGEGAQTITATVTPSDTTDTVVWVSSAPNVASITVDGNVCAVHSVSNGNAVITVTCGDYSATCSVDVSGIENVNILAGISWSDGFINTSGEIKTSPVDVYTDKFDVSNLVGEPMVVEIGGVPSEKAGNTCRLNFYDSNGAFISYFPNTDNIKYIACAAVPSNAAFARLTCATEKGFNGVRIFGSRDICVAGNCGTGEYYPTGYFDVNDGSFKESSMFDSYKIPTNAGQTMIATKCISAIRFVDGVFNEVLSGYNNSGVFYVTTIDENGYVAVNINSSALANAMVCVTTEPIGYVAYSAT